MVSVLLPPSSACGIGFFLERVMYVVEDQDGKTSILFGIYGIPETILINKELIIIKKIVGPIDKKQFEEILNFIQ